MIEFDRDELFRKYKDIVKVCISDGYALPFLLKKYNVPSEYCLSDNKKKILFDNMSDDTRERLYGMLKYRRKMELLIFKGEISDFSSVTDFHEKEVLDFVEVYPMFESIIL